MQDNENKALELEAELKQLFMNNFDCYALVVGLNDVDVEAITCTKFIEVVSKYQSEQSKPTEIKETTLDLENWLIGKINLHESMHKYEIATDSLRCYIEEYNELFKQTEIKSA